MIPYLALPPGKPVLITDSESPYFEKWGTVSYIDLESVFVNFDGEEDPIEFNVFQLTPEM
jgi:hypothetical protein